MTFNIINTVMNINGVVTCFYVSPDGPKHTFLSSSSSGEIEEGSSVTLSCSSEANPAAEYIWFKVYTDRYSRHMNKGPQLIISYIWSLDSGQYRCDATNKLGKKSVTKSIDVKCE